VTEARGVPFLMYHQVVARGMPAAGGADEARYAVDEDDLRAHLVRLSSPGRRGVTVSDALADLARPDIVALTFDDGWSTDLHVVAPRLREAGFGATFYVVAGSLGRPGFLTPYELRQLGDLAFEIGSHSLTHAYLADLSPAAAERELLDSRLALEDVLGRPVRHFSCPGGSWSPRLAPVARAAGYFSVVTSHPGLNPPGSDRFGLRRIAVVKGTGAAAIDLYCEGRGLMPARARHAAATWLKRSLGRARYLRVRAALRRAAGRNDS
jgi:peptidoglycan/xylan/chitin deacetylase (PgdA/CDA1 family)